MAQDEAAASLAALDERRREQAMARFAVLRPHLEKGVPLVRAAGHAGIPVRTAERWLARYHRGGLAGWRVPLAATPARAGCRPISSRWSRAWR